MNNPNQYRFSIFIFCICTLFLFHSTSCNQKSKKIEQTFSEIKRHLDSHPDSAITLLKSIHDPLELNGKQLAYYLLYITQAYENHAANVVIDTLDFFVYDNFSDNKNFRAHIKIGYNSGKIYKTKNNPKRSALQSLSYLYSGQMFYDRFLFENAIGNLETAANIFSNYPEEIYNEITCYKLIANYFFSLDDYQTALIFYKKSLQLTNQAGNCYEEADIKQDIGILHMKMGDIPGAKKELFEAMQLTSDTTQKYALYLCFSNVYEKDEKADSAFFYAKHSLFFITENNDWQKRGNSYWVMSRIEEKKKDFENALKYFQLFNYNYCLFQNEKEDIYLQELQKKYDSDLKKTNYFLFPGEQWIIISAFLSLLIFLAVSYFLFRKNRKNKRDFHNAKNTIYQLKEMLSKKDHSTHAIMEKRFDLVKKLSLMEGYLREDEKTQNKDILRKINRIIYDKDCFEWDVLYEYMNELHKGFLDKIKDTLPILNEMEFRICCLTYVGLNTTEISIILKLKQNTIHIKKTHIRKKLNLSKYGDINQAIDNILPK